MTPTTIRDWRRDPDLVKAQERLADIDHELAALRPQLAELEPMVAKARSNLHRARLYRHMGRPDKPSVEECERALNDAEMEFARVQIAIDDLEAERAATNDQIPAIEKAAKDQTRAELIALFRHRASKHKGNLEAAHESQVALDEVARALCNQFDRGTFPGTYEGIEVELLAIAATFRKDLGRNSKALARFRERAKAHGIR